MSDFGGYTHPTGRKNYRCQWCGDTIPQGEKHTQYTGMWEGEFQNWRMHDECYEAGAHFSDDISEGFTPYDNERPKKKMITFTVALPPTATMRIRYIDNPEGINGLEPIPTGSDEATRGTEDPGQVQSGKAGRDQ